MFSSLLLSNSKIFAPIAKDMIPDMIEMLISSLFFMIATSCMELLLCGDSTGEALLWRASENMKEIDLTVYCVLNTQYGKADGVCKHPLI